MNNSNKQCFVKLLRTVKFTQGLTAVILTTAALLAGCARQPTIVPADDPVTLAEAASEVLEMTVYLNTQFNLCSSLHNQAEYEALTVQQNWLDKNWPTVVAADSFYSEYLQSETIDYDNRKIALAALLLSHNAQERAIADLALEHRSLSNQEKTCVRRMQTIAQNEMALTNDPQTLANLQGLQKRYGKNTGDHMTIFPVPTLAADISFDLATGRSYYALAEAFQKECPQAQFIVVSNQWPQETYATYCNNTPVSLIDCEWGKCKTIKTE